MIVLLVTRNECYLFVPTILVVKLFSMGMLFPSLLQIIDEFFSHKITLERTRIAARICIYYHINAFCSHSFISFKGLPLPLNFNIIYKPLPSFSLSKTEA